MKFFMEYFPRTALAALAATFMLGTCTPRPSEYVHSVESACVPEETPEVTNQRIVRIARGAIDRNNTYGHIPEFDLCTEEMLRNAGDALYSDGQEELSRREYRALRLIRQAEKAATPRQVAEEE